MPIFENHSALNLIYSFFDTPCYLCVLLAVFYIAKIYKIHNLKIKNISIIILFLFGLVYFLSVLGLLWFDMYYFGVYTQAFITLVLCTLFLWLDRVMFVAITISLIPFALQNDASFAIFDFIICPYLWLYCGARILFIAVLKLGNMMKYKIAMTKI
ncbi:hypothetical protein BKN38_05090 [Helicobacter sp. CLO-3]|nr:hypothetical protein BA723_06775 [Helicobacter sp. CLO-3]OHU83699.1 hypothetical protein BKN38_05090 [Helicobacter sp. CLO-3]